MEMNYTKEQLETIKNMVKEFDIVEGREARRKKIGWYSLASGIKDEDIVRQILIDLKEI